MKDAFFASMWFISSYKSLKFKAPLSLRFIIYNRLTITQLIVNQREPSPFLYSSQISVKTSRKTFYASVCHISGGMCKILQCMQIISVGVFEMKKARSECINIRNASFFFYCDRGFGFYRCLKPQFFEYSKEYRLTNPWNVRCLNFDSESGNAFGEVVWHFRDWWSAVLGSKHEYFSVP